MKILLLTRNHVVLEFISLVVDRVSAKLYVAEDISSVKMKNYDFVFVDDRGDLVEQGLSIMDDLGDFVSVVLYGEDSDKLNQFDVKLKKPFLPSDIQNILEEEHDNSMETKEHLPEDQILNIQDIEEIRMLLEDKDIEVVHEEDLVDEIDSKSNDERSMEERLLEALTKMEPKKIRKLLSGAEVNISIKFPKVDK